MEDELLNIHDDNKGNSIQSKSNLDLAKFAVVVVGEQTAAFKMQSSLSR